MTEEIKKILKSISGRVVAFGFRTEKYEKIIELNKKIQSFDIYNEFSKKNKLFKGKSKSIKIKKLRRIYKKKNIDYVIIQADNFNKYIYDLVIETVYIGKKVYIYGNKTNVEKFIQKFERYNITFEQNDFKDNVIYKIDIESSKNSRFKEKFYKIKDKILMVLDIITDILTA